ncbi:hypothetical protein KC367_g225 [Hortaea werneckii]|nr:hypothetical protein KC367_g225 [Hortaea werneckii]
MVPLVSNDTFLTGLDCSRKCMTFSMSCVLTTLTSNSSLATATHSPSFDSVMSRTGSEQRVSICSIELESKFIRRNDSCMVLSEDIDNGWLIIRAMLEDAYGAVRSHCDQLAAIGCVCQVCRARCIWEEVSAVSRLAELQLS